MLREIHVERLPWKRTIGIGLLIAGTLAVLYSMRLRRELIHRHAELMATLVAGDFTTAYRLTTDGHRRANTLDEFAERNRRKIGNTTLTKFPGEPMRFWLVTGEVLVGPGPLGAGYVYEREHGEWRFTGEIIMHCGFPSDEGGLRREHLSDAGVPNAPSKVEPKEPR